MRGVILEGCVLDVLQRIESSSFHAVVTSPPYLGLRDYGVDPADWPAFEYSPLPGVPPVEVPAMRCSLGLEGDPLAYVGHLVLVFRQVRRVLRGDGTLWLNLGDSYASRPTGSIGEIRAKQLPHSECRAARGWRGQRQMGPPEGLKHKDRIGVPWRVALALQADGWYLRQENIWWKRNAMPESVKDRSTTGHEQVFQLSPQARYYYDSEAVREADGGGSANAFAGRQGGSRTSPRSGGRGSDEPWEAGTGRNQRSVWDLPTEPYPEAHFAVYPASLPERCIAAATSEAGCCGDCGAPLRRNVERVRTLDGKPDPAASAWGDVGGRRFAPSGIGHHRRGSVARTVGWTAGCSCGTTGDPAPAVVLDPFAGAGTTGVAALTLGRRFVGVELSPVYARMARSRLAEYDLDARSQAKRMRLPAGPLFEGER